VQTQIQTGSALAALKALVQNKPVVVANTQAAVDPALAGATREKNVVRLGEDPAIKEKAEHAALMKNELEKAQAAFEAIQGEIRDYGKEKRSAFNDHFRTNVTTVAIPYGDEKAVQVICANRYSVKKDLILNNQDALGPAFNDLFVVETTKKLRADGEQRLLDLLLEVGLDAETSQQILDKLVDVEHTVKTVEDYEQKEKLVNNPGAREVLTQAVSRAAPALKFIG
jgi:hypothetical protein